MYTFNPTQQKNRLIATQSMQALRLQKNRQALPDGFGVGWMTGIEPATSGTTIQYSNQLSYIHRLGVQIYKKFLLGNLFQEYLLAKI